ncbi:MAG: hypothetical protein ACXWWL_04060 [Candidatus Limnocylindria bacterium]
MRQSPWSIPVAALALGGLIAIGGTTVGGDVGLDAAASGVLALTASLYVLAALAIRQRVWRRLAAPARTSTQASRVGSRRVF